MTVKAEKGDLIRITKGSGWYYDKVGEIYEVIDGRNYGFSLTGDGDFVYVDHPDNALNVISFIRDHNYVIHRKAGEEDAEDNADNVNHPSHYTQGGVEVIDIIAQITRGYSDGFVAYALGNTLKYIARAPYKHDSPTEDIKKAIRYLEFALNHIEEKDGDS